MAPLHSMLRASSSGGSSSILSLRPRTTARLAHTLSGSLRAQRPSTISSLPRCAASSCLATTGSIRTLTNYDSSQIKKLQAEQPPIVRTPTMYHTQYTGQDVAAVKVAHFTPQTFSDKVAFAMIRVVRFWFDLVTRYHHPPMFPQVKGWQKKQVPSPGYQVRLPDAQQGKETQEVMELGEMRKKGICMTPEQWMVRIVFLETIAGIPGLVAAACRHLSSLRLMRRDKGWIHTLLEDSENERMHLLTAMQYVGSVGPLMRFMTVVAQGVFWNMFFAAYLVLPRAAHRFVGALEEEAVVTYTGIIQDIEQGRLPEWENLPAVQVAKEYWGLPEKATMVDVIYAIRADEATHRFVNHTLGSLDPKKDFNPFANHIPSPQLRGGVAGLTREQAFQWAERAERDAQILPQTAENPLVMTSSDATDDNSDRPAESTANGEPVPPGQTSDSSLPPSYNPHQIV